MNNFKLVGTVKTSEALVQLLQNSNLWNQNPLRTKHQGTAHKEVDDIWLRFNDVTGDLSNILNNLETQWYEAKDKLIQIVNLTFELMAREKAVRLGRVMLSRIANEGRVYRHRDEGNYPHYYERYHIVLQGGKGNFFFCGDEYVEMLTGQIWWFQNLIEHEVYNNSGKDRIHLIVDLKL